MTHAITTLSPIPILVVAILCFLIGGLWYSPILFGNAWLKEMKATKESMMAANAGQMPRIFGYTFLLTLVSTVALATLLEANHFRSPIKGAEMGLFVGAGLVAAREGANALFERRSFRHFLIVAAHDVVLLTIQGAILAVWR
jgi:hypothetical protein